jgi:Uma2 family endonuclease
MPAVSTAPAKKLMTAAEFYEFVNRPENEDRFFELVRGEVIELSRPDQIHGTVASNVALELKLYARKVRKGNVVGNDSGVILEEDPDTVVGPDVAYFTEHSEFKAIPDGWAEIPPLLAVEVLSPSDRPGKTNMKIRDYLDNGVKIVWVIDCDEKNVTVYRPGKTIEVVDESGELTGGDEIPGFRCPVRNLFVADGEAVPVP